MHLGILAHSTEGAALCFLAYCQEGARRTGRNEHPDVTLDYIAFGYSMPAWDGGDYAPVRATLATSVQRLARAGADFFACPDNTAHLALEHPGPELALPGLHIAEVVADAGGPRGLPAGRGARHQVPDGRPALPAGAGRAGYRGRGPGPADRDTINRVIFDELVNGVFTGESAPGVPADHRPAGRRGAATRSPWCAPRSRCW